MQHTHIHTQTHVQTDSLSGYKKQAKNASNLYAMFINKALKGFKFGNAEKEQDQARVGGTGVTATGGATTATTATMEHNDAINNKQASWEACKLFWLKLKLGTSHKTHTKLCRIQRKAPAKVYAPRPSLLSPGIVLGICAAKKFKCLCEINCCASLQLRLRLRLRLQLQLQLQLRLILPPRRPLLLTSLQWHCRRSMAAIFKPKQSYRLHTQRGRAG